MQGMVKMQSVNQSVNTAHDPMTRRTLPDDGHIVLRDYGYRAWGPELVQYTMHSPLAGSHVLLNGDGEAVPFQVDGDTFAFVARVPRGDTASYTLHPSPADRSGENSSLYVRRLDDVLELGNGVVSLRMPAPHTATFDEGLEAGAATPPLLQWANAGGGWMGGAHFVSSRKIVSQTFSLIRQGPVVVEYEARYRFLPTGEYVWRLRICTEMPIAIISEEFDFDAVTQGEHLLVLDLHAGWRPSQIGIANGTQYAPAPSTTWTAFDAYLETKRTTAPQAPPVGGVGIAPTPVRPGEDWLLLEQIVPGGRWGAMTAGVQVSDDHGRQIAIVPLYLGSWRRTMALDAWYHDNAGIAICLPISVRLTNWALDLTDDRSPFSSQEHDCGLKFTYGRREWGFYVGDVVEHAQPQFGYIGLDRYKDWDIEYPEEPSVATYPGGLFAPDLVKQLRESLATHPQADMLQSRYLLSGNREDAIANAREVIDKLSDPYPQFENDLFVHGLSVFRKVQLLLFVNRAEDALACPSLPADLRAELRARLTLYAYVTSDPDFNPRGAGCHLGNNTNMPVNRTTALALFAPLLPDHPRYAYWMRQLLTFATFKLNTQTAYDGAHIECPTYQLYAPAQGLNLTLNALRNRGYDIASLLPLTRANLIYLAHLTMPDPRWGGARIIPGMGNSENQQQSIWGISMALFADDPPFAGWLKYLFRLSGEIIGPEITDRSCVGHAMYYLPGIDECPRPLTTTFLPTYGVVFRNHFATPNETAMLFRAGVNWGHWDLDPLNVILYGKGAPLSPGTMYQYYSGPPTRQYGIYHNQVKVGDYHLQEIDSRVDVSVTDYGFGPHADYAVASRHYPPDIFTDGQGEMWWNRHILFVKSPSAEGDDYFLFRDTFPSGESRPTWWTWLTLEGAERISVDGIAYDPATVPVEQVVPEAEYPHMPGQTVEMHTQYGAATWMWFTEPRDVRARMTFQRADETKTILEIPGTGTQGYTYVVYPRRDGDPPPSCQALAPGVVRVTTRESTDYLFLSDHPLSYDQDDVTFTGKAGTIRIFADQVVLCMNAGSGHIGYQGHLFAGNGPFERQIPCPVGEVQPMYGCIQATIQVTDEPEKVQQTVELALGIRISGEGAFTAALDDETIHIHAQGRARVLHVTMPSFILRPQYWIDGVESMACWTDYPASGWGAYQNTWLIALPVPDGDHHLIVKDMQFPAVWTRPFAPLLDGVLLAD